MGGTELVYKLFSECRTGSGNTHSGLCVLDPSSFEHIWPVVRAILVAMIVKGALTVVTFGIKVPAGIFIPTLGVGACAGRVLGIGMQWLQLQHPDSRMFHSCRGDMDCGDSNSLLSLSQSLTPWYFPGIVPGLYAMVGAAAALSGVTVNLSRYSALSVSHTPTADNRVVGGYHVRADGHSNLCSSCDAVSSCRQDIG